MSGWKPTISLIHPSIHQYFTQEIVGTCLVHEQLFFTERTIKKNSQLSFPRYAVGDMTMSGWKPTISLIHPPPSLDTCHNVLSSWCVLRKKCFKVPDALRVKWPVTFVYFDWHVGFRLSPHSCFPGLTNTYDTISGNTQSLFVHPSFVCGLNFLWSETAGRISIIFYDRLCQVNASGRF